jgi:hypothetical protein
MTARGLLCLALLSGYLSAAPHASPARGPAESLTVCQLFEHLPRYNGRLITITGPIIKHLGYVIGPADCDHRFVTHGFTWPSMVMLATTAASELHGAPAPFSTDQASVHALDLAILAAAKETEVWVTATGVLRLKRHYHSVRTNYGVLGDGYGHLGASPALLIIQKVDRVDIRGAPEPTTRPPGS